MGVGGNLVRKFCDEDVEDTGFAEFRKHSQATLAKWILGGFEDLSVKRMRTCSNFLSVSSTALNATKGSDSKCGLGTLRAPVTLSGGLQGQNTYKIILR